MRGVLVDEMWERLLLLGLSVAVYDDFIFRVSDFDTKAMPIRRLSAEYKSLTARTRPLWRDSAAVLRPRGCLAQAFERVWKHEASIRALDLSPSVST